MKVASRILNILVLIAAIGAAVCAYILFEKREQITLGRQYMAQSVVKTVRTIDPEVKISADQMSIKKPAADLKAPLTVLENNAKKIVEQRNRIAQAVADMTNGILELQGDNAKTEKDFTPYKATEELNKAVQDVLARGQYYTERNQKVQQGLNKVISALNGDLVPADDFTYAGDPDNSKVESHLNNLAERAGKYVKRHDELTKHASNVATILELENNPSLHYNLDDTAFAEAVKTHIEGVNAFAEEKKKLEARVKELEEQNKKLEKKVSELEKRLKRYKDIEKQLADANKEIERLKDIIDPSWRNQVGANVKNGAAQIDTALLRKLVGKVTFVNDKYGFVEIDLGKANTVQDKKIDVNTGKQVSVDKVIGIPADGIMTVATSLDPNTANYVARVLIVKVGDKSSIANIIPMPGAAAPKVGDVVFFSESDMVQMRAIREIAAKKAADAAALEKAKAEEAAALAEEKEALSGDVDDKDIDEDLEESEEEKEESDDEESDDEDFDDEDLDDEE